MFTVGPTIFGSSRRGPVQFVSATKAATQSLTVPAHQPGDFVIVIAEQSASLTIPALAAGFTSVLTYAVEPYNSARRMQVLRDSSNSVGVVTCTGATSVEALVYRGVGGLGAIAQTSGGPGTSLTIPALSLQDASGASWVVGYAATNQALTQITTATGLTFRDQKPTGWGGTSFSVFDTNGPVASFGGAACSWASASAYYTPFALELLAG